MLVALLPLGEQTSAPRIRTSASTSNFHLEPIDYNSIDDSLARHGEVEGMVIQANFSELTS